MPDFAITIREATSDERRHIEEREGRPLASDHCIGIWLDADLVGWGDDYGTFHPAEWTNERQRAGEELLLAAQTFWEATLR